MQLKSATMQKYQALAALEQGASQFEIVKALGIPKYTISRYFTSMAKQGLIRPIAYSRPRFYEVTKQGKDLLQLVKPSLKNATKDGCPVLFRYHALFFQSEIRSVPGDWEKRLEKGGFVVSLRRHYRGWQVKTEDVTVFVSGKSVWWLVKPVWAGSIGGALNIALGIALGAKNDFEARFGFRLGYPERVVELSRQELALVGGLTHFIPDKFSMQDDRLRIDHSEGPAEIETHHAAFALDDMKRIFEFQSEVARGTVSVEELRAIKDILPVLKEVLPVVRDLGESLRIPRKERDSRELV